MAAQAAEEWLNRIAIAMLLVLSAPQLFGGTFLKTVAAAQKEAKAKNQLIFVDLFAQWCGWCHKMEKDVFPTAVFQGATKDMVLLRLDTEDRAEGTKFARDYGITQLPTFLILTPELELAGTLHGYSPAPEFVVRMSETRGTYEKFRLRKSNEKKYLKTPQDQLEFAIEILNRRGFADAEKRLVALSTSKHVPVSVRNSAYFHAALAQLNQQKRDVALATLTKFRALKPSGEFAERAQALTGQIYLEQRNYKAAAAEFRKFKSAYPSSPLNRNIDAILPRVEAAIANGQ